MTTITGDATRGGETIQVNELDIQALRLKTDNELIHALLTSDDDLLKMLGKRMAYIARYGAGRHEVTAIEAQPRP